MDNPMTIAMPTGHAGPAATLPKLEDLRDAWRDAREDAVSAYRAWDDAELDERRTAYAVFVAAADREEAAERGYLAAIVAA